MKTLSSAGCYGNVSIFSTKDAIPTPSKYIKLRPRRKKSSWFFGLKPIQPKRQYIPDAFVWTSNDKLRRRNSLSGSAGGLGGALLMASTKPLWFYRLSLPNVHPDSIYSPELNTLCRQIVAKWCSTYTLWRVEVGLCGGVHIHLITSSVLNPKRLGIHGKHIHKTPVTDLLGLITYLSKPADGRYQSTDLSTREHVYALHAEVKRLRRVNTRIHRYNPKRSPYSIPADELEMVSIYTPIGQPEWVSKAISASPLSLPLLPRVNPLKLLTARLLGYPEQDRENYKVLRKTVHPLKPTPNRLLKDSPAKPLHLHLLTLTLGLAGTEHLRFRSASAFIVGNFKPIDYRITASHLLGMHWVVVVQLPFVTCAPNSA